MGDLYSYFRRQTLCISSAVSIGQEVFLVDAIEGMDAVHLFLLHCITINFCFYNKIRRSHEVE